MVTKKFKQLDGRSLALLELIQNCMDNAGVKEVKTALGCERYTIIKIGFPNLMKRTVPLTIVWSQKTKETTADNDFRLFSEKDQRTIAEAVFNKFPYGENNFETLYNILYKQWYKA
ncbi:MAG: hypothetical protein J6Y37_08535 [Paludibacteraceae bacterium]|nr:hypothetical protein [Paludibacteraceae bacterium]